LVCLQRAAMLFDWPLFYISFALALGFAAAATTRITFD
jgi:hypothetical protein